MTTQITPFIPSTNAQRGFTLMELMIVVAIIAILAAFAYPAYQNSITTTKRTDMMSEMHNIATQIQNRKLAQGSYDAISEAVISDFHNKDYPIQGAKLYTVTITPDPLTSEWQIIADPTGTQMADDGTLSLSREGVKCRASVCGTGDEWQ